MSDQQKTNLLVPEKLRAGFQKRSDTYTGSLAYLIYFDKKGVLRKERSWQTWRDKSIDPVDHLNVPTEGFVLNKKVGGYSNGWHYRSDHIRIYDPRGFEFEITPTNLLFILSHNDCFAGKGLAGTFVYAWDKTELYLLPTNCPEYQQCLAFTEIQAKRIGVKSLVEGHTYLDRELNQLLYLGKRDWWDVPYESYKRCWDKQSHKKTHVFWDGKEFLYQNTPKVNTLYSDLPPENYAELVDSFLKGLHGSRPVKLEVIPGARKRDGGRVYDKIWYVQESETSAIQYHKEVYGWSKSSHKDYRILLAESGMELIQINEKLDPTKELEGEDSQLWITLESGSKFLFGGTYCGLIDPKENESEEGPDDDEY